MLLSNRPKTGIIRERTHELAGKSVANKILVFPSGKASPVVQIDGLYKLVANRLTPKAMIVKDAETVLVVTEFLGKVPLVDRLDKDPFTVICTGDYVRVTADKGTLTVAKRRARAR